MTKQVLQQALEALELHAKQYPHMQKGYTVDAIEALRSALAQQGEQQPVAWLPSAEWTPCVKLPVTVHVRQQRDGETHVSTREGITPVKPDDLIMRGVSGEEYPIGREIFEKTYRLGEAAPAAQPQCDTARVLEWMRTPNRKAAQLAFTEGPERQAAYWIEIAQGEPAAQQGEQPVAKDLMWATVAMQERHDKRTENTVATLEKIKQEQAARYQPVKEAFWWRVRIGDGAQTIGRCYTETEAQRLAAELQRAFNDGAFCVEKVVCNGELIGAAAPAAQPLKASQVNDCCEEVFGQSIDMMDLRMFDFARAVEKLHGIGADK